MNKPVPADGRTSERTPILSPDLHRMLNQLLDVTTTKHPGVEYHLTISDFWAEDDLPDHEDRIWRHVEGKTGYYKGAAYRDTLIDRVSCKPWLVIASPLDDAPNYYGDMRTGEVTETLPADALLTEAGD